MSQPELSSPRAQAIPGPPSEEKLYLNAETCLGRLHEAQAPTLTGEEGQHEKSLVGFSEIKVFFTHARCGPIPSVPGSGLGPVRVILSPPERGLTGCTLVVSGFQVVHSCLQSTSDHFHHPNMKPPPVTSLLPPPPQL